MNRPHPYIGSTTVLPNIVTNPEKRKQTDVVYLDFGKTLDSVSHQVQLTKLCAVGIVGGLWKWFRAYLTSCQQYVSVNNQSSNLLTVTSGVLQDNVLHGPVTLSNLHQ